jgi:hypothetical protein
MAGTSTTPGHDNRRAVGAVAFWAPSEDARSDALKVADRSIISGGVHHYAMRSDHWDDWERPPSRRSHLATRMTTRRGKVIGPGVVPDFRT